MGSNWVDMKKDDILCGVCGNPIDVNHYSTDEDGFAVHVVCVSPKKTETNPDSSPPQHRLKNVLWL